MNVVLRKTYTDIPIDKGEILRYAGADKSVGLPLLDECLAESDGKLSYKICYIDSSVNITENTVMFDFASVKSENLAKHLCGCKSAVVFAATVGVEIDRLISKYGRISPLKALIFQAIGAQQIEGLCDAFSADMASEFAKDGLYPIPRFSPGYGDLAIDFQREIFKALDCPKQIGLTLNDSLVMSPSKSVTAIMGLSDRPIIHTKNKCDDCDNSDCCYRG